MSGRLRKIKGLAVNALCVAALCSLGMTSKALADSLTTFVPPPLKIIWERDKGRKDAESIKSGGGVKAWAHACANIAGGLMAGKGAWGMGIFSAGSCYIGTKKTAGKDGINPWVLRFVEGEEETTLSLYTNEDEGAPLMSSAKFKGGVWGMKFFDDKGFADMISLRLLNELPVMGLMRQGSLEKSLDLKKTPIAVPASGVRNYKVPSPPEELTVFTAQNLVGFVMPDIKGKGVKSSFMDPESYVGAAEKKRKSGKEGDKFYVIWTFEESVQAASNKKAMAFQDARGAGMLVAELNQAIDAAANLLLEALDKGMFSNFLSGLQATASAGYVGIRYGKQIFPGSALLKKMTFFGLVGEFRSGWFDGLRYYYDKSPEVTAESGFIKEKIAWSRHVIGKSFGLKVSRFVDKIDFVPKIGLWNVNAELGTVKSEDGDYITAGKFHMPIGYSVSLEAGMAWISSWYTIRPWASYDYAGVASKISKKTVTSARGGVDAFWTAGPTVKIVGREFHAALLAFAFAEKITLIDHGLTTESTESGESIGTFSLTMAFVGAGIAISW